MALEYEPLGLVQRAGLAEDLLRDGELAEVVQAAGEACELDRLRVEAHPLGHAGCELADHVGVAARVRVARVDGVGEAGGRAQAGGAVGALGQPAQLLDPGDVRPVDADGVLALLLRHVERAVGDADEVGALDAVLRIGGDAAGHAEELAALEGLLREALDDRARDREALVLVAPRKQEGEFVAAEPEGLAALAEACRHLREDAIADRVAVPVVDLLEVVDVEQDEREREPLVLCLVQVVLEALVEVAVVAEPGERVGERQAHRLQRAVHRALVERDGDERADEGRGEERRALPEDGQHEADRGHDREGNDRPVDRALEQAA